MMIYVIKRLDYNEGKYSRALLSIMVSIQISTKTLLR